MLLEELIIRPGTEQSRTYLRNKCNDFMNRIDQLKLLIQIENTNKELTSKQEALKAGNAKAQIYEHLFFIPKK